MAQRGSAAAQEIDKERAEQTAGMMPGNFPITLQMLFFRGAIILAKNKKQKSPDTKQDSPQMFSASAWRP